MASKQQSGGGTSFGAWMIILVTLSFVVVWFVISPNFLMQTLKTERAFSEAMGGRAADQWIYGKMIAVSIDQARDMPQSIKDTQSMPEMMQGWAQSRIIATWLWASLILYRANMMLLYFFILIPFLAAVSLDGLWVKEISTYRFSSQSPIRHRFGVIILTWTTSITCLWVILPAPIPSVVAPLAILLVGFGNWMWMANQQKRI